MNETPKQVAGRLARANIRSDFKPEALHVYTDEKGEALFWRIRARLPDGSKWIRPMRLDGQGYELGEPDFPNGKPLYRLHELKAKPGAPAWFVEGENCADALTRLGVLATTAGGASSDERADFSPLAGRAVTIWPDNDAPGVAHGERVAAKLRALECKVEVINVAALGLPEGGDAVDWRKAHENATAADLAKLPRLRTAMTVPVTDETGRIVLRCVADIEARPVRWLWPGRIARGKVSMLAGHPGLGKSQVSLGLAAIVTTGGLWPVDRTCCERGRVVIFSAEDDPEDTIRPRLEAAGSDLSRCHIFEAVEHRAPDGTIRRRAFSLVSDMPRLSAALVELPDVALVIIDPLTAYLGETDSHKNAEVRAVLAPLAELAAQHGVAIIAISHLRKSTAGEALLQVTGSLAFVAAARAAYVVVKDQNNPQRRLMLPIKNNLGEDQTGYAFSVESARLSGDIETSRVRWEAEPVTVTADEALAAAQDPEERSAVEDAAHFLRGLLANGPVPSKQVRADAEGAGHSWAAVRRAQKTLGVEVVKGGLRAGWEWRLAPKVLKTPEDAQEKNVSIFGTNEHLPGITCDPAQPVGPEGEAL